MVCALAILFRIAHNGGSGEYFIHVLTPIFLMTAYQFLAWRGLTSAVLCAGILQVAILLPPFPKSHLAEWQVVEELIAAESKVLHSPTTVKLAVARGETMFDSGQSEFFEGGLKKGSKYYPEANLALEKFHADIWKRTADREFSLIVLNKNRPAVLERDRLSQYYKLCEVLPAPLYRNPENELEFWRPVCINQIENASRS